MKVHKLNKNKIISNPAMYLSIYLYKYMKIHLYIPVCIPKFFGQFILNYYILLGLSLRLFAIMILTVYCWNVGKLYLCIFN